MMHVAPFTLISSSSPCNPTFLCFTSSVSAETGLIDYAKLAEMASIFKPALIICGGSAYPREWDYKR